MPDKTNFLLITADDMNWDAVGAYGCPVHNTTPNIDQLANDGIRFQYAHVNIAVCQPSRSAIMTGRYPHRSGGEGFFHLRQPDIPILPDLLRQHGYQVGILGKVTHSTPYADFQWDMTWDMDDLGHGRNPSIYHQHAHDFFTRSKQSNQPFFLMLNSHDPHRPFYGNDHPQWYDPAAGPPAVIPSQTFTPDQVTTPGFLADLPEVRLEIAEYYNSVRRCDDTVAAALNALQQAGLAENTMVIFLSDNGMAFPFAKTNCYLHSTRTPWIIRWPKTVKPGSYDQAHFISGIDLLPTILDIANIQPPGNIDGRSFLPLLQGQTQTNRNQVFTQFHQTAGKNNFPMRCVQNHRFGYIFNPWSDGQRVFKNESQAGRTFNAMRDACRNNPHIQQRVNMFLYRTPQEFYDFENDPDALNNLIDDPKYRSEIQSLQNELDNWMQQTNDPALPAFRGRHSPQSQQSFMQQTAEQLGGQS